MSEPTVVTGVVAVEYEDSYCAAIADVIEDADAPDGPSVRLTTYQEDPPGDASDEEVKALHAYLNGLDGKRVRVTIEVLS